MPAPLLAAAIPAAASLIGTGGQVYANGKMNKKTREWNEKMYDLQRGHALSDWDMQNAYNSPLQQMQRLQEAGLNPNLVYGNGTVANSTSQPRSTETKSWNPQTPDLSGIARAGGAMGDYMDMQIKEQQLKNLQGQLANMGLDASLKGEAISGKSLQNSKTAFELSKAQELKDVSIETAHQNLNLLNQKIDQNIDVHNARLAQMAENTRKMAIENGMAPARAAKIQSEIRNLEASGRFKEVQAKMAEQGINPNDGFIIRQMNNLINGQGTVSDVLDNIEEYVDPSKIKKVRDR